MLVIGGQLLISEWRLANPGDFFGDGDIGFPIGAGPRLPTVVVEIRRPVRLPFKNAEVIISLDRGRLSPVALVKFARLPAAASAKGDGVGRGS